MNRVLPHDSTVALIVKTVQITTMRQIRAKSIRREAKEEMERRGTPFRKLFLRRIKRRFLRVPRNKRADYSIMND